MAEVRLRLSDDHDAVSEVLEQLLSALKDKDVKTSHSKLDLLWARLAVHIRAEHLHLFPTVIKRLAHDSSEAQSLIDNLRADHDFFMRELARAVGILRELPRPLESPEDESKWNSVVDTVLSVKARLENHNEIEEEQIYRWSDTILTKPEQTDLVTRINAELQRRPPRFSAESWAKEL